MRGLRMFLVAAATAGTLGACAPLSEQAEFNTPETRTTLVVQNQNWSEMVIYLVRGTTRARLGSVLGMNSAKFQIPDVLSGGPYGELRVMADPIGSNRVYTSEVIHIVPGTQVELNLANNLAMSHYSVF